MLYNFRTYIETSNWDDDMDNFFETLEPVILAAIIFAVCWVIIPAGLTVLGVVK